MSNDDFRNTPPGDEQPDDEFDFSEEDFFSEEGDLEGEDLPGNLFDRVYDDVYDDMFAEMDDDDDPQADDAEDLDWLGGDDEESDDAELFNTDWLRATGLGAESQEEDFGEFDFEEDFEEEDEESAVAGGVAGEMLHGQRAESFEAQLDAAEEAEFGDEDALLDWMSRPEDDAEAPAEADTFDEMDDELAAALADMPVIDEQDAREIEAVLADTGNLFDDDDEEDNELEAVLTDTGLLSEDEAFFEDESLAEILAAGEEDAEEDENLAWLSSLDDEERAASVTYQEEPEWMSEDYEPLPDEVAPDPADMVEEEPEEELPETDALAASWLTPPEDATSELSELPEDEGDVPEWLRGMAPPEMDESDEALPEMPASTADLEALFADMVSETDDEGDIYDAATLDLLGLSGPAMARPDDETDTLPEEMPGNEPDWLAEIDDDLLAGIEAENLDELMSAFDEDDTDAETAVTIPASTGDLNSLFDDLYSVSETDDEFYSELEGYEPLSTADLSAEMEDLDVDELSMTGGLKEDDFLQADDTDWGFAGFSEEDDDQEPEWLTTLESTGELNETLMEAVEEAAGFDVPEEEPEEPPQMPVEDEDPFMTALAQAEVRAELRRGPDEPVDLDALLASFDEMDEEPDAPQLRPVDFDTLFGTEGAEGEEDELDTADTDWLREVAGASTMAASVARQQQDRPIEELDPRLQALRDKGLEILGEDDRVKGDESRPDALLPAGALAPVLEAPATVEPSIIPAEAEPVNLTTVQERNAALLREMTGTTAAPASSRRRARRAARRRLPLGRWLVAALLLIAVSVPFFAQIDLGTPPEDSFQDAAGLGAFARLESLSAGERVLFAAEYGPTSAAELDPLLENLMAHVLLREARPVIVSSDVVGLLRAESTAERLSGDANRNVAYYPVRYIPAGSVGLRDLAANTEQLLATDTEGQPNGLAISDLNAFGLIVLVTDRAETVRAWMEQIIPQTRAQVVVATGFAAMPLTLPYVQSEPRIVGHLTGYGDAVTYNQMLLDGDFDTSLLPLIELPATSTPTSTPTPTASSTPTATFTPSATTEPCFVQSLSGNVNVRSGPGTEFGVVGALASGEQVVVRAQNGDGSWYQIVLEGAVEAWVASSVVTTSGLCDALPIIGEVPPTATLSASETPTPQPPSATPTASPTASPTPTESQPTETAAPTQTGTPEPSPTPEPPTETPTPEPVVLVDVATVIADTTINVRNGPGTNFGPIAVLRPGARLRVVDFNEDGSWTRLLLPDGREGWVATFLLRIDQVPEDELDLPQPVPPGDSARGDSARAHVKVNDTSPRTALKRLDGLRQTDDAPADDATEEPEAMTEEPAGPVSALAATQTRWQAMTLGLLIIIGLIVIGNGYYLLRHLLRRGRTA